MAAAAPKRDPEVASALEALASKVREWRERHGVTQTKAAKLLGLSQGTISHLETPDQKYSPTLVVLLALRRTLGMSLDELLGLTASQAANETRELHERVLQELQNMPARLAALTHAAEESSPPSSSKHRRRRKRLATA
jgi:transcriptional regulator with XRE-family HTH domain